MKLLISLIFLSSCASIINEKNQLINISTTSNTKTKISIYSQDFDVPGIVSLPRSKTDLIVKVHDEKCNSQYLLNSDIDNIFWVNVFSGIPFGATTDYATEKMWKYQDNITIQCQ